MLMCNDRNVIVNIKPWERCYSGGDAGGSEPISFGYYSPDALPLSFRRLARANATKLSSCDKTPSLCLTNMSICAMLNDRNVW